MRKIVAGLFLSLDGVVESPEKLTFPYFNDEVGQETGSQSASSDTRMLKPSPLASRSTPTSRGLRRTILRTSSKTRLSRGPDRTFIGIDW